MKIDPFIIYNMAAGVIGFYLLAAICWFYIFRINVHFGQAYPAACLFMGFLWIYYAYKNYDFYFIDMRTMDQPHMWENLGGALCLATLSFMMCLASNSILRQIPK